METKFEIYREIKKERKNENWTEIERHRQRIR